MTVEQLLIQYGIASAVIVVVVAFLKYLKLRDDIQANQRDKFLSTIDKITDTHDATIKDVTEKHERTATLIAEKAESASKEVAASLQAICIRLEHCPNRDPNGRFSKGKQPKQQEVYE